MLAILNYLCTKSKAFNLTCAILLILIIWTFNYYTRNPVSVLYLIPITQLAWCVGERAAVAAALATLTSWIIGTSRLGTPDLAPAIPGNPWVRIFSVMLFFFIYVYLLTQLKRSLDHEKKLARTDHLTGAGNGLRFNELALVEMQRAARFARPFSVLYLDLDNFKKLNDVAGHTAGDRLLAIIGKALLDNTRQIDGVARLGGDEFAVLLSEASRDLAWRSAKRIQAILDEVVKQTEPPITFSIGVVTFETPPATVDEVLGQADSAMYMVKNRGKNGIWLEVRGEPTPIL